MNLAWIATLLMGAAPGPSTRLDHFPPPGQYVRLAEAQQPWMQPLVGWRFVVVKRSRIGGLVRLRADYGRTDGGPILEIAGSDWSSPVWGTRSFASYFEAVR